MEYKKGDTFIQLLDLKEKVKNTAFNFMMDTYRSNIDKVDENGVLRYSSKIDILRGIKVVKSKDKVDELFFVGENGALISSCYKDNVQDIMDIVYILETKFY